MRAKKKEAKRFLCGEPRLYENGLAYLRIISADTETQALFAYIEDRSEGLDPGDEVGVIELGPLEHVFVLMADEELPAEEVEADNE